MNYFELFDIPVTLKVDKTILPKKYFELQKKYHPDFHTLSDEDEQVDALEMSSVINKAFKTLQQPDERIRYVLLLKGLLEEEEKYQLPPDFLMEMMELNEHLSADSTSIILNLEQQLYEEVKGIIEFYDDKTSLADDLVKVKEYYFKKKYLQRILDRMEG